MPLDADSSGLVTPIDALIVLNEIERGGARRLPEQKPVDAFFVDSSADGEISALDAHRIVNALGRYSRDVPLVAFLSPDTDPVFFSI